MSDSGRRSSDGDGTWRPPGLTFQDKRRSQNSSGPAESASRRLSSRDPPAEPQSSSAAFCKPTSTSGSASLYASCCGSVSDFSTAPLSFRHALPPQPSDACPQPVPHAAWPALESAAAAKEAPRIRQTSAIPSSSDLRQPMRPVAVGGDSNAAVGVPSAAAHHPLASGGSAALPAHTKRRSFAEAVESAAAGISTRPRGEQGVFSRNLFGRTIEHTHGLSNAENPDLVGHPHRFLAHHRYMPPAGTEFQLNDFATSSATGPSNMQRIPQGGGDGSSIHFASPSHSCGGGGSGHVSISPTAAAASLLSPDNQSQQPLMGGALSRIPPPPPIPPPPNVVDDLLLVGSEFPAAIASSSNSMATAVRQSIHRSPPFSERNVVLTVPSARTQGAEGASNTAIAPPASTGIQRPIPPPPPQSFVAAVDSASISPARSQCSVAVGKRDTATVIAPQFHFSNHPSARLGPSADQQPHYHQQVNAEQHFSRHSPADSRPSDAPRYPAALSSFPSSSSSYQWEGSSRSTARDPIVEIRRHGVTAPSGGALTQPAMVTSSSGTGGTYLAETMTEGDLQDHLMRRLNLQVSRDDPSRAGDVTGGPTQPAQDETSSGLASFIPIFAKSTSSDAVLFDPQTSSSGGAKKMGDSFEISPFASSESAGPPFSSHVHSETAIRHHLRHNDGRHLHHSHRDGTADEEGSYISALYSRSHEPPLQPHPPAAAILTSNEHQPHQASDGKITFELSKTLLQSPASSSSSYCHADFGSFGGAPPLQFPSASPASTNSDPPAGSFAAPPTGLSAVAPAWLPPANHVPFSGFERNVDLGMSSESSMWRSGLNKSVVQHYDHGNVGNSQTEKGDGLTACLLPAVPTAMAFDSFSPLLLVGDAAGAVWAFDCYERTPVEVTSTVGTAGRFGSSSDRQVVHLAPLDAGAFCVTRRSISWIPRASGGESNFFSRTAEPLAAPQLDFILSSTPFGIAGSGQRRSSATDTFAAAQVLSAHGASSGNSSESRAIMATQQGTWILMDLECGCEILSRLSVGHPVSCLTTKTFFGDYEVYCMGGPTGAVSLVDSRTPHLAHTLQGQAWTGISQIACSGPYLVTCKYSSRRRIPSRERHPDEAMPVSALGDISRGVRDGSIVPNRRLCITDLRTLQEVGSASWNWTRGPVGIFSLPLATTDDCSSVAVFGHDGLWQSLQLSNHSGESFPGEVIQGADAGDGFLAAVAVCPVTQRVAAADSKGVVSLWEDDSSRGGASSVAEEVQGSKIRLVGRSSPKRASADASFLSDTTTGPDAQPSEYAEHSPNDLECNAHRTLQHSAFPAETKPHVASFRAAIAEAARGLSPSTGRLGMSRSASSPSHVLNPTASESSRDRASAAMAAAVSEAVGQPPPSGRVAVAFGSFLESPDSGPTWQNDGPRGAAVDLGLSRSLSFEKPAGLLSRPDSSPPMHASQHRGDPSSSAGSAAMLAVHRPKFVPMAARQNPAALSDGRVASSLLGGGGTRSQTAALQMQSRNATSRFASPYVQSPASSEFSGVPFGYAYPPPELLEIWFRFKNHHKGAMNCMFCEGGNLSEAGKPRNKADELRIIRRQLERHRGLATDSHASDNDSETLDVAAEILGGSQEAHLICWTCLLNGTAIPGMETTAPFDFCNVVLQALYYSAVPLKEELTKHTCSLEYCLRCELGFLFHMLDIATLESSGLPCQASDFMRVFKNIPGALSLGFLRQPSSGGDDSTLDRMAVAFFRFVIEHLHREYERERKGKHAGSGSSETSVSHESRPQGSGGSSGGGGSSVCIVSELFGAELTSTSICEASHETELKAINFLLVMSYDVYVDSLAYSSSAARTCSKNDFCAILENSMKIIMKSKAFCKTCESSQRIELTREITRIPPLLVIDCAVHDPEIRELWKQGVNSGCRRSQTARRNAAEKVEAAPRGSNFLTERFWIMATDRGVLPTGPRVRCERPDEVDGEWQEYELKAVVLQVSSEASTSSTADSAGSLALHHTSGRGRFIGGKQKIPGASPYRGGFPGSAKSPETAIRSHLAIHVKVSPQRGSSSENASDDAEAADAAGKARKGSWVLLNDFMVTESSAEEATDFSHPWKQPVAVIYGLVGDAAAGSSALLGATRIASPQFSCPISLEQFLMDENKSLHPGAPRLLSTVPRGWKPEPDVSGFGLAAAWQAQSDRSSFLPLGSAEVKRLMTGEMLVALDAEFVALGPGVVSASGKSPAGRQLSLARVSVVRGDGPWEGIPFLDHYIMSQEDPKDYLTEFSGILPGDLQPMTCVHWLTSKKSIYQKLRFLVDAKCRFVGHGLSTDFRIINLKVPRSQMLDTVELYRKPANRMISLKYLCSAVLKMDVQKSTHDSVEDAKAALALYKKFCAMEKEGGCEVKETIQRLYKEGFQRNWQPTTAEERDAQGVAEEDRRV